MSEKKSGTFVNFVLLEDESWSEEEFLKILKEEWQIEDEVSEDRDAEEYPGTIVISYHGAMICASLVSAPVPDGEAEYHAQSNYRWREAQEIVKKHKAHLMVAVLGSKISATEAGELLVKAVSACCRQEGVLGIYANETVYQPEFYLEFIPLMKKGMFPIFNLVWFGLYNGNNGICGYTCGMKNFGYDEIEVIDSSESAEDVVEFLSDIAMYVIVDDVLLQDGETIGFTEEQKLPITKSEGVAVEGESLKIGF